MSTPDQTITLSPVLPAEPIILCNSGFLHTLATVEREVAGIAITDAASAQAAANLQVRLTAAAKALEDARTKLKAPFIAKGREIDEAAKAPATRIEQAKRGINSKLVQFQQAEAERARKAEQARQAELDRLQKLRDEEARIAREKAAEVARLAMEAAAKSTAPVVELDFDEVPTSLDIPKTEIEKQIDAVRHAPAVVAAKPEGVRFTCKLIIDTVDASKLPDQFVVREPKLAAIRSLYCVGWKEGEPIPECPGVTFKVDRMSTSTGRSVF